MIMIAGHKIVPTIFPDGTSQVWKLPSDALAPPYHVFWKFENEAEIIHLAQLKSLLDAQDWRGHKKLHIEYLPYARQDKEVSNTSTFALKSFATLLNAMEFDVVEIEDPHSTIATREIYYSHATYPKKQITDIIHTLSVTTVVYPDHGADSKYSAVYGDFGKQDLKILVGEKERDQLTGHILKYSLNGDPKGEICLIVDDICDFGNTFILLSKQLKELGAKEIYLFVSHGLFSGGLKKMEEAGIARFFTKDGEVCGWKI